MGLYSSPAPPPPPDYTAQKSALRLATEENYKNQANEYNTAVDNYNTNLTNLGNQLMDIGNNYGSLSIADLYDDPNTAENENMYDNYMSRLNAANQTLSGLNVGVNKPTFSSVIQSEYGPVGITNIPTLNSLNSNLYNNITGEVSNAISTLNNLQRERTAEENRLRDIINNASADLSGLTTQANQLGIADLNQMNQLERDLESLASRQSQLSSPIYSQLYPNDNADLRSSFDSTRSILDDLRSRRAAEEQRIKDYESALLGNVDSYSNTLGGLTIANDAEMRALQDQIDQLQRGAGRFSSELGFDFNDELGELGDVEYQLGRLQNERENELDRISRAQDDYLARARAVEQLAEGTGIYSRAGIDAAADQLGDLSNNISSFSSLLPFDFSGATGSLDAARNAIDDVLLRREDALNEIQGGIGGITDDLADIELYNEQGFRDRLGSLRDVSSDLARFSGGRVDDIQGQIDSGVDAVNARLQELADYRTQLEERAQGLMETVNNASYYGLDDLTGNTTDYDAIQAEAELYNASQAMDEIDAIMNRLNSEKQRLEADAEAVAARRRAAAERTRLGTSGLPTFGDLSQVDPMTLEQYLAMLASDEEEDPTLGQLANSGFSNNLGIIRVGG